MTKSPGASQYLEANVASAATCNIGAADAMYINITGTTTITSLGTTINRLRFIRFSGALTLTHHATSLILPNGGSNIVTAAGDTCIASSDASGNWRVRNYQRADGSPVSVAKPSFSAVLTSNMTGFPSNSNSKVTVNVEEWDDGGYYDATNSKWTPPAGKGRISASVYFSSGLVDQAQYQVVLYKNGAAYKVLETTLGSGTTGTGPNGSASFSANGTDYFELFAYKGGAGTGTILADPTITYFQGEMN
jgi:FlaG/FlaF family flagellin (archaellin)